MTSTATNTLVTRTVIDLPVHAIVISADTQARVALRDATIREYAELLTDGSSILPPIIVFTDGSSYWLADGFHRHAAHRLAGRETIRAWVELGSKRDAMLYACQANGKHGLQMSIADKRRAVELMLNDKEIWEVLNDPDDDTWTQRKLARHCGVSHTFVANMLRDRDQYGNVATFVRTTIDLQTSSPTTFVDDVLDHANPPEQSSHVTTTTIPSQTQYPPNPPRSNPHNSGRPAPLPMMTILITWSYADTDGNTIEGEAGVADFRDIPTAVRGALLQALRG